MNLRGYCMEKEIKRFKSQKEQLFELLLFSTMCLFGLYIIIDTIVSSEENLIASIMNWQLIGRSGQRGAIALQQFVISNFGKKGFLIFITLCEFVVLSELLPRISTYRRFKKREREIREGLRAPDDYVDDYVRVPLWRKIANLFTKKRKKKYPSEREMRDSLKKNKYYKE